MIGLLPVREEGKHHPAEVPAVSPDTILVLIPAASGLVPPARYADGRLLGAVGEVKQVATRIRRAQPTVPEEPIVVLCVDERIGEQPRPAKAIVAPARQEGE